MGRRKHADNVRRPVPACGVADHPDTWDVIVAGWDYWQEAFCLSLFPTTGDMLDAARAEAADLDTGGDGRAVVTIGGEQWQVHPHGMKGGVRAVMENADMIAMVRGAAGEWPLSIRCRASAIWQHGLQTMRDRMARVALAMGDPRPDVPDWRRLSRADMAFDCWAPSFAADMRPELFAAIVQPGRAKEYAVGRRGNLETITLGRVNDLQVTIYDKGREVAEVPEKDWITVAWAKGGRSVDPSNPPARTIWRVEVRCGKEYLERRSYDGVSLRDPDAAFAARGEVVTEALFARRITVPTRDTNRHRWPLHPLFGMCWKAIGEFETMPPIGKVVSMGAADKKLKMLRSQMAGTSRSLTVLANDGAFSETVQSRELAAINRAVLADDRHDDKVAIARERYRYIHEGG